MATAILVQDYFSASAARHPDKTAVVCQSERISYGELERRSDALAARIRRAGVERGSLLPIFMRKSVGAIESMLGILKADCAYIPVDVASPRQRLLSIFDAAFPAGADTRVVLVDDESESLLGGLIDTADGYSLLNINRLQPGGAASPVAQNLSIDIAYVMFTSGSTGQPKGVMVPHGAITDYIDWCADHFEVTGADVVANHAPLYFDNSVFDIYTAFKAGAELHLVPDELNAIIPRLAGWLEEHGITLFFCVPTVLAMLHKSRRLEAVSFPALRHVICAGETLHRTTLRTWSDKFPHIRFTNMYGPTEITVDCSYYTHDPGDAMPHSVPIGVPRRNMELFVRVDDGTLSTSAGAEGELLVRGGSVSYGYLGDAEKTRSSFIQNPGNTRFHDPLYCTGDRVRIGAAGEFLFLGRLDGQIKYLGHRIETGEIEASMAALDDIVEGVVVFDPGDAERSPEIGALLLCEKNSTEEELQAVLRQCLPRYMVPGRIVLTHDPLPRTANGKYDRQAASRLVFTPT